MCFNSNPSELAQKLIFIRKTKKISHPLLRFSNTTVSQSTYQKHFGTFLDTQSALGTFESNYYHGK